MRVRRPDYFNEFRCIASACKDSCCVGWEIDIEEEKAEEYLRTEGRLGEKLKNSIQKEDGVWSFALEHERCPFLDSENLCELILESGEELLCAICREHPRFYEWFGSSRQEGLGNCCEAAVRLLLSREEVLQFETEETPEEGAEELTEEQEAQSALLEEARDTFIGILQDRSYLLKERLSAALCFAEDLQELMDQEEWEEIPALCEYYREKGIGESLAEIAGMEKEDVKPLFEELFGIYRSLEIQSEEWRDALHAMGEFFESRSPGELENSFAEFRKAHEKWLYEYEHLAVYAADRYFMKAFYDGEVLSKAKLSVLYTVMTAVWNWITWAERREASQEERFLHAKIYSKEIEYNPDNVRELEIESWESYALSTGGLLQFLRK